MCTVDILHQINISMHLALGYRTNATFYFYRLYSQRITHYTYTIPISLSHSLSFSLLHFCKNISSARELERSVVSVSLNPYIYLAPHICSSYFSLLSSMSLLLSSAFVHTATTDATYKNNEIWACSLYMHIQGFIYTHSTIALGIEHILIAKQIFLSFSRSLLYSLSLFGYFG